MRVLIIGAAGQLGSELSSILKSGQAQIGFIPKDYRDAELLEITHSSHDFDDDTCVRAVFDEFSPDIVFNCAAYTDVDGCEKNEQLAFASNATLPGSVASNCSRVGAKLVHVSTDYVFSGTDPGERVETHSTDPVSTYGKSKLTGELLVARNCLRSHVVRTSWLFGRGGKNFVETMLKLADSREEISVVDDQLGNPTNANDLAYEMLKIAQTDLFGIWHCSGEGICSWADFAAQIMTFAKKSTKVVPISSDVYKHLNPKSADRPKYSAMKNRRLIETIGNEMRDWRISLADYIEAREN